MQSLQDFVPANSRAQFRQLRMKQRGALLVHRTDADSADYKAHERSDDPLAAARGIVNALLLTFWIVAPVVLSVWIVTEFWHE